MLSLAVGWLCLLAAVSTTADAGSGHGSLELDENNWTKVLTGEWMVLLYVYIFAVCFFISGQVS